MRPGTPHWLRVWATRKYSEGLYFPCNIRIVYVDAATLPPLTRDAKVELHHWLAYIKLAPKALAYAAGMLFVRSNEDRASVVVDTFEERGFPMDELMECVGKGPGVSLAGRPPYFHPSLWQMNRKGGAMIMIFQTRPITFFNSVLTMYHHRSLL
jgi:hypothetical protein